MKLGKFRFLIFYFILFFFKTSLTIAEDKIESIPLINLEDLSPTFEEDKSELEKQDEKNLNVSINSETNESFKSENSKKIYINLTALDKITAKTSSIRLAVGEIKSFGSLEIKALKCAYSKDDDNPDTLAYIQVKDLSSKDNNQVFLFNGWTFASNPTLQSIDHPVYDLWIINCENI